MARALLGEAAGCGSLLRLAPVGGCAAYRGKRRRARAQGAADISRLQFPLARVFIERVLRGFQVPADSVRRNVQRARYLNGRLILFDQSHNQIAWGIGLGG